MWEGGRVWSRLRVMWLSIAGARPRFWTRVGGGGLATARAGQRARQVHASHIAFLLPSAAPHRGLKVLSQRALAYTRFLFLAQFELTSVSPPVPRRVRVRLHLPSFAKLDVEELRALVPELILNLEGWWEATVDGWWLSEATKLAATAATTL